MKKLLLPFAALVMSVGAFAAETEEITDVLLPADFGIIADGTQTPVDNVVKNWTSAVSGITYKASLTQYPKVGSSKEPVACFVLTQLSKNQSITFARPDNLILKKVAAEIVTGSFAKVITLWSTEELAEPNSFNKRTATKIGEGAAVTVPADCDAVYFAIQPASSTASVSKLTLVYEKGQVKELEEAGLKFSAEKAEATMGEEFTPPALSKDTDGEAEYSSSDTGVAKVDAATGAVTLVAPGTAKITATTPITDSFKSGEASYTLTVLPATIPTLEAWIEASPQVITAIGEPLTVFICTTKLLVLTDGTRFLRVSYDKAPYKAGDIVAAGITGAYSASQALMVNIRKTTFAEAQSGEVPDIKPEALTVPEIVDGNLLGRYVELAPVTIRMSVANQAVSPGSDSWLPMVNGNLASMSAPQPDNGTPGMRIIGFTLKSNKAASRPDIYVMALAAAAPDALYARCGAKNVEMTADGSYTFTAKATLTKGTSVIFDNGATDAARIVYGAATDATADLPLDTPATLTIGSEKAFTAGEDGEYTLTVEFGDTATTFSAVKEVAGIEGVTVDGADHLRYYDLNGVSLSRRPDAGLYIERDAAGAALRLAR